MSSCLLLIVPLCPATSEAGARWPRRRGGRFKNMGLWGPFHLKRPLTRFGCVFLKESFWPSLNFRALLVVRKTWPGSTWNVHMSLFWDTGLWGASRSEVQSMRLHSFNIWVFLARLLGASFYQKRRENSNWAQMSLFYTNPNRISFLTYHHHGI
jgi:hypothetical protein